MELVADTRLSVRTDPYLTDYRIDDLPMLPAAMVLEAMAQAASALAGRELRHLANVQLAAPVLLLGRTGHEETVIRVCALRARQRRGNGASLRRDGLPAGPRPSRVRRGGTARGSAVSRGLGRWPGAGHGGVAPGAMVDGTDLYGQVFFQAGRFRRVAFLPEASSRGCRALVRGGDDLPWFGAAPGPVDAPLVLGSPGLNDATLHVLQACLPHRRVLATGCESVAFSGREVRGALRVQAVRRPPMAGDAAGVLDVVATDATGQPVVTWQGVGLRDVGALAPAGPWHPALLAISMEARAAEFGLDPGLRAVISCGAPPRDSGAGTGGGSGGAGRTGGDGPGGNDQRWADRAAGTGPLEGFELAVRASRRVACRWQAVGGPAEGDALLDEALIGLRDQLAARLREPSAALEARLATITAALAALGREPGTPLRAEDACDARLDRDPGPRYRGRQRRYPAQRRRRARRRGAGEPADAAGHDGPRPPGRAAGQRSDCIGQGRWSPRPASRPISDNCQLCRRAGGPECAFQFLAHFARCCGAAQVGCPERRTGRAASGCCGHRACGTAVAIWPSRVGAPAPVRRDAHRAGVTR